MKNALMILGFLVAASAYAQSSNAAITCPDLKGKWVGSCQVKGQNLAAVSYLNPLIEKMKADEMEISQPADGDPLACRMITIQGEATTIGGMRTQTLSFPLEIGTVALGLNAGSSWVKESLVSKATGLLQVPTVGYIGFGAADVINKKNADTIERAIRATGEGFDISVNCIYKRL